MSDGFSHTYPDSLPRRPPQGYSSNVSAETRHVSQKQSQDRSLPGGGDPAPNHMFEGIRQVGQASSHLLEELRNAWSGRGGQEPSRDNAEREKGPRVNKVTVVIDGVAREGVIDATGAVQVTQKGTEYFSIASEEPEQAAAEPELTIPVPPLPSFGRPLSGEGGGSPFDPKARSPFQPAVPPPPPPFLGMIVGLRVRIGFLLDP